MQDSLLAPRPDWLPAAFAAVGRHQFLTARQIAVLVDQDHSRVGEVLGGLVTEKLLVRLQPTQGLDGAVPDPAFALTRRGATLVAVSMGGRRPLIPNHRKSLYMLAHELVRNELGVVLEILDREGRLKLLRWETARTKIGESVHLLMRGRPVRVPLVADALAVIEIAGKPTGLLVEVDMGTVSIPRMTTKYAGYFAWWKDGGPARRFGLRSLRVLTLAPSENRLTRLREAAMDATAGGSGLFWFGEQKLVDVGGPQRLLGSGWTAATRDHGPSALW